MRRVEEEDPGFSWEDSDGDLCTIKAAGSYFDITIVHFPEETSMTIRLTSDAIAVAYGYTHS